MIIVVSMMMIIIIIIVTRKCKRKYLYNNVRIDGDLYAT